MEFDINYLYRVPIGLSQRINFETFSNAKRFEIFVVSKEELFAGKTIAALDRYLDYAEYKPELLFYEYPDLIPRIEEHPALLWKRLNVEKYLKR